MYAIVKFTDECDAPGIVCCHWITKDQNACLYPNVRSNEARDRLLRRYAEPGQDWSSCKIKILHKYDTFNAALQHLRQAEETSNLDSDEEVQGARKRSRAHLAYPGEETDDDSTSLLSSKYTRKQKVCSYPYPDPPRASSSFPSFQHQSPAAPSQPVKAAPSHSNQTIMNGKMVAWMADIALQVQQLHGKLDLVLVNQQRLLSTKHQVQENEESSEDLESLGNLPMIDDDSFMELNKKLSESSHLRNLLIKVLTSVGGRDMKSHIHNMLKRVLSDEVAEIYSLSGKSTNKNATKKPFSSTEISKLIFSVCQRIFKNIATEVKVKEAVQNWLQQAKVRRIRRMQRQEKNMGKDAELLEHQLNVEKDVE